MEETFEEAIEAIVRFPQRWSRGIVKRVSASSFLSHSNSFPASFPANDTPSVNGEGKTDGLEGVNAEDPPVLPQLSSGKKTLSSEESLQRVGGQRVFGSRACSSEG